MIFVLISLEPILVIFVSEASVSETVKLLQMIFEEGWLGRDESFQGT